MSRKIIINDANILIDLIKIELIDPFFRLEKIDYVTSDFVFEELLSNRIIDHQTAIQKIKLLVSFNTRLPKKEIAKRIEEWTEKAKL